MEPFNKNILVIDDKRVEIEDEILTPLSAMGYSVDTINSPEAGVSAASHHYSIIFIDFKYENSINHNGFTVCTKIREKCPLSSLILCTGYGGEIIEDSYGAPWDAAFEKGRKGVRPSELSNRLLNVIIKAVANRGNALPVLRQVESDIQNNTPIVAEAMDVLNRIEEGLQNDLIEGKDVLNYSDFAVSICTGMERAALSLKFGLRNKETGSLKKKALIFRGILLKEPEKYQLTRKCYGPLKKLVQFYGI